MPNLPPDYRTPFTRAIPDCRDEVRTIIRLKHYSIRTEQAYSHWICRFILYHQKRHPRETAEAEVVDLLSHLARDEKVAASTQTRPEDTKRIPKRVCLRSGPMAWTRPMLGRRCRRTRKTSKRVALLI